MVERVVFSRGPFWSCAMDGSCLNFKYLLRFEKHYGQMTNGSLCVTRAMQLELAQNWGIRATVLYDQPPEFFCPTSLQEKRKIK
ncbi:Chitobiosyldiphosphodolichol beta-mannosyltransferase [Gossypium arboreum]|uniref:Chitobiosyldiphosphodolichol beta-mannosyltransferase n=1 Tax=Gossypium arboreum TaxID=29729 RepID=A0A0B0MY44_GOSAR|nr:Chitobiosyldiphosphodolichol beta-mannosyltransferase [Gossypium arboreum]